MLTFVEFEVKPDEMIFDVWRAFEAYMFPATDKFAFTADVPIPTFDM
jgi:hypothetical protein